LHPQESGKIDVSCRGWQGATIEQKTNKDAEKRSKRGAEKTARQKEKNQPSTLAMSAS